MSKRITTRWYIGAWVVWIVSLVAMFVMAHGAQGTSPPPGVVVAYFVMAIAGIVMLVMWIGALIKLAQLHAWGWFAAVLVLNLLALGIIGMVAYAVAGPDDVHEMATRPTSIAG